MDAPRLGSQRLYRTPLGGNVPEKAEISIDQVFRLMDRWRHLPDYQLERRADIFFALFLPEVLKEHFHLDQEPILIPEFPVKDRDDNRPHRVDYLALQVKGGEVCKRAFLVELKTDMGSRSEDQDRMLRCAASRGMRHLVLDVLDICEATDEKRKYVHLLKLLSDVGLLVEYREDLWPVERGFSERLRDVKAKVASRKGRWPSLEVVYVQPLRNVIDFDDFASILEKSGEKHDSCLLLH